jgi:hypothetical protein
MAVSCEDVWREISNYLDGDIDPNLRAAMDEHFLGCQRCTSVRDGLRNVVELYGDERMSEVPIGFGNRLHQRLDENIAGGRRRFLGLALATAAAGVFAVVGFEVTRPTVSSAPEIRSEHAESGNRIPPEMMVVVSTEGKIFHRPGCTYIHDKTQLRTITAHKAQEEGYTPCVHCLKKYLG